MDKENWKIVFSVIIGIVMASLVAIPLFKIQNKEIRGKEVAWTNFEVDSWHSAQGSQKVARVILGLRRDGTVVWKEENLVDGRKSSCLFFGDK